MLAHEPPHNVAAFVRLTGCATTRPVSRSFTLLAGTPCGILRRAEHGRLTFIYDDDYIAEDAATPLSLSMPLTDQP